MTPYVLLVGYRCFRVLTSLPPQKRAVGAPCVASRRVCLAIATMAPPVLLVVLRGEAFRFGEQPSRDASADLSAQLEMLNALQRNVLHPAERLGWVVQCVAHLSYTARTGSTRNVRSLLAALQRLQVYPVEIKPAAAAAACKEATQLASIMRALQWSARTTAKHPTAQEWGAMLLIQADLVINHPLPLPPAAASGCEVLLAPNPVETSTADPDAFAWPDRPCPNASRCTPGGLWYLPRCRYHDFRKNLSKQSQLQQQRQHSCTTVATGATAWRATGATAWRGARTPASRARRRAPKPAAPTATRRSETRSRVIFGATGQMRHRVTGLGGKAARDGWDAIGSLQPKVCPSPPAAHLPTCGAPQYRRVYGAGEAVESVAAILEAAGVNASGQPRTVLVLGAGHSGTSTVTAEILKLGWRQLTSTPNFERHFTWTYEDGFVIHANEIYLKQTGADKVNVNDTDPMAACTAAAADSYGLGRCLLSEHAQLQRRWKSFPRPGCIKDPRFVWTLHLWPDIFSAAGERPPLLVHVRREQAAVRRSHEARGEAEPSGLGMSLVDAVASRVHWAEWQLRRWCGPAVSFDVASLRHAGRANHYKGKPKRPRLEKRETSSSRHKHGHTSSGPFDMAAHIRKHGRRANRSIGEVVRLLRKGVALHTE